MNDLSFLGDLMRGFDSRNWLLVSGVTLVFAGLGRAVRGVTSSGAIAGALVCFALVAGAGWAGLAALCVVFWLTWISTRIGKARKQSLGTAEARGGRNALQVLANVGVAAAGALIYKGRGDPRLLVSVAAALTEAAADTVSSEIGKAVGGIPRLITSWKPVAIGTDGAVTVSGSIAGASAGLLVGVTCAFGGMIRWPDFPVSIAAGIVGMLVDSLLGATLERQGILDNNGVNLLSTASAAILAWVLF
jgi:uncharacterized protein (TIGR00297 family)